MPSSSCSSRSSSRAVTTLQAAAERDGKRIFTFRELGRVALKVEAERRLTPEQADQWSWLPPHLQRMVLEQEKQLRADEQMVRLECRTIPGAREFHAAVRRDLKLSALPRLRTTRPAFRTRQSRARHGGRRVRGTSSSRGDPHQGGGDDPPPGSPPDSLDVAARRQVTP